jgi:Mannose-1-phosphate guanylyltransferase
METANSYFQSGAYYWNSGMFAFKAGSFLSELEKFNPTMLASCQQALNNAKVDMDFIRLDKDIFSSCPADSIDYAVMEKQIKQLLFHWMPAGMMLDRGLHYGMLQIKIFLAML